MPNETLDQYKLREARESAKKALERLDEVEREIDDIHVANAERDVKLNVATSTLSRLSYLFGTLIVSIVGYAVYFILGAGGGGHP